MRSTRGRILWGNVIVFEGLHRADSFRVVSNDAVGFGDADTASQPLESDLTACSRRETTISDSKCSGQQRTFRPRC